MTGALVENLKPTKGRRTVNEVNPGTKELKSTEAFIGKHKSKV